MDYGLTFDISSLKMQKQYFCCSEGSIFNHTPSLCEIVYFYGASPRELSRQPGAN